MTGRQVVRSLPIGYLIGALDRGGSERQLIELAAGMAERGHRTVVLCYDGDGALDSAARERGLTVKTLAGGSKLSKIRVLREWIGELRPAILHGFMKRASSLAVLANLPRRRCRVVASDLSTASYSRSQPVLWLSLGLFGLADVVATQTEMNRKSLGLLAPWLRRKTVVIRNGVDTGRFVSRRPRSHDGVVRFVCVGSVYRVKNPVGVVEASRLLREANIGGFRVDWYGRKGLGGDDRPSAEFLEAGQLIEEYGLQDVIVFHGETALIEEAYASADAVLHPSLQEGFPNAVIEAMASRLPVVVSSVSDLPLIVEAADNGFVCDPHDRASIAAAMRSMIDAGEDKRTAMGERSRELAWRWFGRERFLDEYENLYRALAKGSGWRHG